MALPQTKSSIQRTKITLASVGALLFCSPSVFLPLPSVAQSAPQRPNITCSDSDNLLAKAYTDKHDVQICGSSNGKYSMIVQSRSAGITLAARPVDDSQNVFEGKTANYTYTLDMSKRQLTIVQKVQTPVKPSPGRLKPGGLGTDRMFVTTVEKITALMQY